MERLLLCKTAQQPAGKRAIMKSSTGRIDETNYHRRFRGSAPVPASTLAQGNPRTSVQDPVCDVCGGLPRFGGVRRLLLQAICDGPGHKPKASGFPEQCRVALVKKGYNMKTSEDVSELGLYASLCCGHEQMFNDQEVFQRCPGCHGLCVWELAESD